MVSPNSIQREIDLHRGAVPENQWLANVRLIDNPENSYEYELFHDWYLPGSESYVLDFSVNTVGQQPKRVVAKACIKFSPVETVREWHERRSLVSNAGISVPRLYSTLRADYIEEFIDMDVRTAFSTANEETKKKLEEQFIETYMQLSKLGFVAISLHDVRSRGDDIVLVDFGSDLGDTTSGTTLPQDLDRLTNEAQSAFNKITSK